MIEVELRTFLTKEKYHQLTSFFEEVGCNINKSRQITYYFSGDKDFRLMLTNENLMLWLKTGEIHDEAREEMTVKIDNNYKQNLLKMIHLLGYTEEIKWYRFRREFDYEAIHVTIDFTHGYGYILEAELMVDDDFKIEPAKLKLHELFEKLNLEVTDKSIFKEKYNYYKENWRSLTSSINENEFLISKITNDILV